MANLQKIIDLIKKTGDKIIILDEKGDPKFVLMSISNYEDLIFGKADVKGLTENELLDKINRDIAIWKENQEIKQINIDQYDFAKEISENLDNNLSKFREKEAFNFLNDEEDKYYFEPVEN